LNIAEAPYGSDREGLVFGYGFAHGEAGCVLESEAVAGWLAAAASDGSFVWLHFNLAAALIAEQNNRSLFILTIVTVLALPINIIAGLFGMNVGGIPLAEHPGGFWMVVAIVASFTGIAAYLAFRKWLDQ
jgi:hypothetical protein